MTICHAFKSPVEFDGAYFFVFLVFLCFFCISSEIVRLVISDTVEKGGEETGNEVTAIAD